MFDHPILSGFYFSSVCFEKAENTNIHIKYYLCTRTPINIIYIHTPINIIYTVYSYTYYIYTNIIINIIYVYTPINIIYTVYSYKYYTYYLLSDFSHCPGLRRADISALYP